MNRPGDTPGYRMEAYAYRQNLVAAGSLARSNKYHARPKKGTKATALFARAARGPSHCLAATSSATSQAWKRAKATQSTAKEFASTLSETRRANSAPRSARPGGNVSARAKRQYGTERRATATE